jgi:hypothetical protein
MYIHTQTYVYIQENWLIHRGVYIRKLVNTYMYVICVHICVYTPMYIQMNSYVYINCLKMYRTPHFAHTNLSLSQDTILHLQGYDSSKYRNGYNQSNTQNMLCTWLIVSVYILSEQNGDVISSNWESGFSRGITFNRLCHLEWRRLKYIKL